MSDLTTDSDIQAMFSLDKKKKKKRKKEKKEKKKKDKQTTQITIQESENGDLYSYTDLLSRLMSLHRRDNPEQVDTHRYVIKPPQLMRVGSKRTLWTNFQDICSIMKRQPTHLQEFVLTELGTTGSIDHNNRLVISGKYVPKVIESLLRKYIREYVTCQSCRSPNTVIAKDTVSRLYFMHCTECGASRSVAAIKAGFHAETRADRRAQRK